MPKSFLSIDDLTDVEITDVLAIAMDEPKGRKRDLLKGKHFALLFEKPSLRTKASFEVGIRDLGGQVSFFGANEVGKLGERESVADLARVLSGYYDGVIARVFDHAQLTAFTKVATIPVINALSDYEHPCQCLADLLTIKQELNKTSGFKLTYLGDGNNVARSLAIASSILGFEFMLAGPQSHWIDDIKGGQTEDPAEALKNTDVIYTDTWTSMGDESEATERKKIFAPYQLNSKTLALAKKTAIVLHCLPAHRGEEITDEVIDGPQSAVFKQAANRLPAQKALLMYLTQTANLAKMKG